MASSTAVVLRLDRSTHPTVCTGGPMGPPVKPEGDGGGSGRGLGAVVMPGLSRVSTPCRQIKRLTIGPDPSPWMAGSSPAMTL